MTYSIFSIVKPTQSPGQSVTIDQTVRGLSFSVEQGGRVISVAREWVEGIPSLPRVPQEFFAACAVFCTRLGPWERKLYFLPKILGGMVRANQQAIFRSIFEALAQLQHPGLNEGQQVGHCNAARQGIGQLIQVGTAKSRQLEVQSENKNHELVQVHARYAALSEQQRRSEQAVRDSNARVAELEGRRNAAARELESARGDLAAARRKLEEAEQRRRDAVTDTLIPGYGFVAGLVTGRHERMIPGHSFIAGTISVVTQDVERCRDRESRKSNECDSISQDLNRAQDELRVRQNEQSRWRDSVRAIEGEKNQLEGSIRTIGRELTDLRNTVLAIREIVQTYRFLHIDVSLMEVEIRSGLLEVAQIQAVSARLRTIEQSEVGQRYLLAN